MDDSKEYKISVTGRFGKDLIAEIDEIAAAVYANRTAIMQECIRFGLEEFKRKRPDIIKSVESIRVRNKQAEKTLEEKKRIRAA